jgi:hypothetical protein
MTKALPSPTVGFLAAILAVLVLLVTSTPATAQSTDAAARVPAFLRATQCYRLTFAIAGAPNWKVLEVLDAGWIKAEVDAGPRSAVREPVWINTAQIITVREVRCSE